MSRVTIEELPNIAAELADMDVEKMLTWAADRFGDRLGMTTAFGYSGIVLMDHIRKLGIDIDIFFIDTGFHFQETLDLAARIRDEWGLRIRSVEADEALREYVYQTFGSNPCKTHPDICCHFLKVAPLLTVLRTKDAWLSAVRRDQSLSRTSIDTVEIDGRGTFKISPLAYWTRDQAWQYIRENGLPYNPLHDQHYPSIGCWPCTEPVERGGDERDGRWKSIPKLECGIHVPGT